jgi:hypothetical protein
LTNAAYGAKLKVIFEKEVRPCSAFVIPGICPSPSIAIFAAPGLHCRTLKPRDKIFSGILTAVQAPKASTADFLF